MQAPVIASVLQSVHRSSSSSLPVHPLSLNELLRFTASVKLSKDY